MIFISNTSNHTDIESSHIEIIEDSVFTSLTTPDLKLREGVTGLAGTTFYAGYIIPFRITQLELASGAILVR